MGATPDASNGIGPDSLHRVLLGRIGWLRAYVNGKIPPRFRGVISPDDVLQEVWIAAYRTIANFEPRGPNALDRWLTTVANSKLVGALRLTRQLGSVDRQRLVRDAKASFASFSNLFERLPGEQKTPSSEFHAVETGHAVLISLNRLNDARRNAIRMRYMEGLSHKEIASKMGKTEGAVNNLLFHGLRQLRDMLGDAEKYFSDAGSSSAWQDAGSSRCSDGNGQDHRARRRV